MSIQNKDLRPKDISKPADILSPILTLEKLPGVYGEEGMEPGFKEVKDSWKEKYCTSLDGIVGIDTFEKPKTKEEEEQLVKGFLSGLEKLFTDCNKGSLEPLQLTMEYCAKCNTCSEACHIFESSGQQEIYRPIFRIDVLRKIYKKHFSSSGSLGSFVGADIDVTWEGIARLGELAYRCNLCRRCAQVCPLGLDNGMVTREIRKIFSMEMGIAPAPIHSKGSMLQLKTGSSTGLSKPAFLDTLEFIEEDIEEKTGRKIKFPIDKEGADIMLFHNAGEFIAWPDNPAAFAILFDEAGLDWTLSSEIIGYDSVNYGIWYDDAQAKKIAMKQLDAAKELGVKRVVMGECGHAHKAMMLTADRMTTEEKVPVESWLPIMAEMVREGKFSFDPSRNNFPVTLHDPCNIVRQMGIVTPQREILQAVAPMFREMAPCGVENYCCGGGSGFAIMNSCNFSDFRNKVSSRKKWEQILNAFSEELEDKSLIKYICAPCSNCKGTIRDILHFYDASNKFNVQYSGLVELMVNALTSMDRPFFEFQPEW